MNTRRNFFKTLLALSVFPLVSKSVFSKNTFYSPDSYKPTEPPLKRCPRCGHGMIMTGLLDPSIGKVSTLWMQCSNCGLKGENINTI